jgi:protein-S-isoprenylcysteine O-methyltransferase Ste14
MRRKIILLCETIVFSVIVPGTVAFWMPRYVLGIWGQTTPTSWSIRHVAAAVPLMLGLAIYLRCLWEFAARGRGIPAPVDHPKQLVVTGLYQYVRNPMYVGVLLFLLGEALFFGSWTFLFYAIGWLLFVHCNVLWYEEPNLSRKFGRSYEHYMAAVNRWMPGKRYQPLPNEEL